MYIIEVDHIILFLTTDTHSYSKKKIAVQKHKMSPRANLITAYGHIVDLTL